ncbi:MAG: hypothetical protein P8Z30_08975 [Acidobacteriota bacterium]
MLKRKSGRMKTAVQVASGLLLIPAGLLMAAGPAQTQKTLVTTASPRISISNLAGKVEVRGWDRLQVHVEYSISSSKVAVATDQIPGQGPAAKVHFSTYVVDHSSAGQDVNVDYIVQVPTGASLEIHDPQGSVKVESIKGDTSVESLGGDISIAGSGGHLSVRSVGGNIEVIRPAGRVEAYSINGNLHFVNPTSSRLKGTTTSGTILYEGDFAPGGDYVLSDYSGDINIICPPTASFELDAKTVRGKLDNQFPIVSRGPAPSFLSSANSIFGTHNTGEATLELTSFSGTIHIRQQ